MTKNRNSAGDTVMPADISAEERLAIVVSKMSDLEAAAFLQRLTMKKGAVPC